MHLPESPRKRRTSRYSRASLGLVLLALLATGCGNGDASRSLRTEGRAGAAPSLDSAAGQAAAERVTVLASKEQETYFQGIIVEDKLVLAFKGTPTADLRSRLAEAADGLAIEYRSVERTNKELTAVADRIDADTNFWAGRGIQISGYGPDWKTNKVLIKLSEYRSEAAQQLEQRYGGTLVTVDPTDQPKAEH